MPRNIKKISKNNDKKTKEIDNRKYKKGEDSGDESDNRGSGSGSGSENENENEPNEVEKKRTEKI